MKKQIKNFEPNDRFLPISVFKFPLGNCGGVTDHVGTDSIYIPCKEGFMKYSEIQNKERIFFEEQRGPEYFALKPIMQPVGSFNGPMSGGNLAYSSDSRCKHVYHVHDRFETY